MEEKKRICSISTDDTKNTSQISMILVHNDKSQNRRISQRYEDNNKSETGCCPNFRYVISFMGLSGIILSQMSRMILNVTITSMVCILPPSSSNGSLEDSCPWPEEYFHSNECIVTTEDDNDIRFDWDTGQKDLLISSFFITYCIFMIQGGMIAEIIGSKYVIFASVFVSGIVNLATPWLAKTNFTLLVISRFVAGTSQAGVFPALYALIAQWNTLTEANVMPSLMKMGLRFGVLLGSLLPGLVNGWQSVYYITGVICMLWSIVWLLIASSAPETNRFISKTEVYRILKKKPNRLRHWTQRQQSLEAQNGSQQRANCNQTVPMPKASLKTCWRIVSHPCVIGLIISKLATNYGSDFLTTILPTYIKDVFHATKRQVSFVNALVALVQVLASVAIGWLVKYTVAKRPFNLSLTGVRTLFQLATCMGQAITLLMLTFKSCDLVYTSGVLILLSLANMLTAGGESMVPLDMNDKYPATIMAMANCFSCLSAFTISPIKSLFLDDRAGSVSHWNNLIIAIAIVNVAGGLIFWWLVKSDPIDFDGDTSDIGDTCDHENTIELRKVERSAKASSLAIGAAQMEAPNCVDAPGKSNEAARDETEAFRVNSETEPQLSASGSVNPKPGPKDHLQARPNEQAQNEEQPEEDTTETHTTSQ